MDNFWDEGPSYDYSSFDVPTDYNFFEPSALDTGSFDYDSLFSDTNSFMSPKYYNLFSDTNSFMSPEYYNLFSSQPSQSELENWYSSNALEAFNPVNVDYGASLLSGLGSYELGSPSEAFSLLYGISGDPLASMEASKLYSGDLSGSDAFRTAYQVTGDPVAALQAQRQAEAQSSEQPEEGIFPGLGAPIIRDQGIGAMLDPSYGGFLKNYRDEALFKTLDGKGYLDPASGKIVSIGSTGEGVDLPAPAMRGVDAGLMDPEIRAMYADAFRDPRTGKLPTDVAEALDFYKDYSEADPTKDPFLGSTATEYLKNGQTLSGLDKILSAAKSLGGANSKETLKKSLEEALVKKLAAQQAYNNSKIGQYTNAAQGALAMAQALFGKNKSATTSARGNQGQAFAPTYVGSSAPKTKYASGGKVQGKGGLLNIVEQLVSKMADQKGLINGEAGGQDDVVDIKAAPGEYIMDAEVVSALGDGNNEEGARKLDQMRLNVRKHKRTGGLTAIPPKAKAPEQYMKKGK